MYGLDTSAQAWFGTLATGAQQRWEVCRDCARGQYGVWYSVIGDAQGNTFTKSSKMRGPVVAIVDHTFEIDGKEKSGMKFLFFHSQGQWYFSIK